MNRLDFARNHLLIILGFFPRVESKIGLLVGLEVAMAGYLAARLPQQHLWLTMSVWTILGLFVTAGSLVLSFVCLYRAMFPTLDSGHRSLIYFREIGCRTEPKFLAEYEKANDETLLVDMHRQIWRNSEILMQKFDRLKIAFICFAIAIPAWLSTLALLP
jgi:hypothetical protein